MNAWSRDCSVPAHSADGPRAADQAVLGAARAAAQKGRAALADGDMDRARAWLGRAHRLAPQDATLALQYGNVLSVLGDARALPILRCLADRFPMWREAGIGLAAAALRAGHSGEAAARLSVCLSTMACSPSDAFAQLAASIAAEAGFAGWLGITGDGTVCGSASQGLALDGAALKMRRGQRALPPGWRGARRLHSLDASGPLLGDPVQIQNILRLSGGLLDSDGRFLSGWVAAPCDPERVLCADLFDAKTGGFLVRVPAETPIDAPPGAQIPTAVGFNLNHHAIAVANIRFFVSDAQSASAPDAAHAASLGLELQGSPWRRGAREAAIALRALAAASFCAPPDGNDPLPASPHGAHAAAPLVVVTPGDAPPGWWDGLAASVGQACPVVRATEAGRSTDDDLAARVNAAWRRADAEQRPGIVILRAGTGLSRSVFARFAAHGADAAQTLASLSALHDADTLAGCARPGFEPDAIRASLEAANAGNLLPIAMPDGPCIYLPTAALRALGPLREACFGETDGALADFAVRANALGWEHRAACDVYVTMGAHSAPVQDDSLRAARKKLDLLLWTLGRRAGAIIFVTHAEGGGVERYVQARAAEAFGDGKRAIVLRPAAIGTPRAHWRLSDAHGPALPDLTFTAPDGLETLAALLRADCPGHLEFHHAESHPPEITRLPALLGVPYDVTLHDYAPVCPRVTLCGGAHRYCGEPEDPASCDDCIADHTARLPNAAAILPWRARAAALLRGARHVRVPSSDMAERLGRYVNGVSLSVTPPPEDADAARHAPRGPWRATTGDVRVAILGALTRDKGFDVLLACARDAARRALPLRFALVGHSIGDDRLMATGHVFVTGPFREGEAQDLLREQAAHIGFLPSVWPETWSYALSELWRAGLFSFAFDLGAQAERIRASGGGTVLPAGLPAARINDMLLQAASPMQAARFRPRTGAHVHV